MWSLINKVETVNTIVIFFLTNRVSIRCFNEGTTYIFVWKLKDVEVSRHYQRQEIIIKPRPKHSPGLARELWMTCFGQSRTLPWLRHWTSTGTYGKRKTTGFFPEFPICWAQPGASERMRPYFTLEHKESKRREVYWWVWRQMKNKLHMSDVTSITLRFRCLLPLSIN